jgi:RNA polymerase sigma-70 factor (ECF subfamily)
MVKVIFPGSNPPPPATRQEEGKATPPDDASPDADVRLMSLVAAGDASAQHALVVRLQRRAHHIADSILRAGADSEDALQAGLLEVLKSAGSFRAESTLERWADRIVVRQVMRVARARTQSRQRLDFDAEIDDMAPSVPEPAASDDLPQPIQFYLEQLPEQLRSVLVLRHSLDHSIQEIAEALGLAQSQVKKRLLRANHLMRRMIRRDRVIGVHVRKGDS